jgi:uncharacterized protein (DUF2252 family)
MVKLKYKAMSVNIFCFYRGTCHLFYEDLHATAALPASPLTWICGDLHLENFGSYKGNNHQEYFDLNDFDEALLAPACWELVRMVTSIFIAFNSLELDSGEALNTAKKYLNNYSATLINGKAASIDPRTAQGIVHTFLTATEKRKQKALIKKYTRLKKGKLKLLPDDRHFEVEKNLRKELSHFISDKMENSSNGNYNYEVLDCVFRVAGTGSIGVKRYLFLLQNQDVKKKYLLLDMKQSLRSSVGPFIENKQPVWETEAERAVAIQQRMQNVSPALLNATVFNNQPYVLNQMQPTEDKINFELIKDRYNDIDNIICDMAVLTASAQLRSSGRQGSAITDELIAFGQNSAWQEIIIKYALQYAKQVIKDYGEFMTGCKKGLYWPLSG